MPLDLALQSLNLGILFGGVLLLISVAMGLLTARSGLPLLLVFLLIGMLAGEDGPGGIVFNDHRLSFWVGNIALAVILLDGGLRTRFQNIRRGFAPALLLATVGVLLSALAVSGLMLILGYSFLEGLLLGAVVGSTDAAAVFSLLKAGKIRLNERITATLELESGLNDPMAVFLTLVMIGLLASFQASPSQVTEVPWRSLAEMLGRQVFWGTVVAGVVAGLAIGLTRFGRLLRHSDTGLLALLTVAVGLVVFGGSSSLGGSGFLAVYLFGLLVGNWMSRLVQRIGPALDGLAWQFQAGMFLLLGLLATPSSILQDLDEGAAVALWLMFVARPFAVAVCLRPLSYSWREVLFVSWVGLRGAVPIVLALFPIIAGFGVGSTFLNIAFVVVLLSLLLQGSSIRWLAARTGILLPPLDDRPAIREFFGDFSLSASAPMTDLAEFYALDCLEPREEHLRLGDWILIRLGRSVVVGDRVEHSQVVFTVMEETDGRPTLVGVRRAR